MLCTIQLYFSVISENEIKQPESTNNELIKKLQNLEATYAEERQAKHEAEIRADIAEKKQEALQDRLERCVFLLL